MCYVSAHGSLTPAETPSKPCCGTAFAVCLTPRKLRRSHLAKGVRQHFRGGVVSIFEGVRQHFRGLCELFEGGRWCFQGRTTGKVANLDCCGISQI
jgi:hypothetical protein